MKIKFYTILFFALNSFLSPLKGEQAADFTSEFKELDPITAFIRHPKAKADQKINETIELNLNLGSTQQNVDDLAKAWEEFNGQIQTEYISRLGLPSNN